MDFEGGNFQADGEEYCYTTERLYLYTGWNFQQVEDMMKQYYGCKKAVVVKDITNDGTGHIDMFFKLGGKHVAFVGEYTVVKDDVNKKRMDDNVKQLEALKYSDGSEGITVYRIPMPNAGKAFGESIPRTFINSTLFASKDGSYKVNLWPIYTVDKDLEAQALEAWEQGMPDWEHVGVISDQVSLYSGAIHCVTRTIPALPLAKWVPDGECKEGVCDGGADGYSGPCIAATEPEPGCWGPAWECLCNDCDVQSCKIPAGCGNATCDDGETCFSCPGDCKCGADEACNVATGKCASNLCGNEKCDAGENCFSCAADCGCKTGTTCSFGVCSADPCDGITYDGCCDGNLLVYCEESNLVTQDCGTDGCGWNEGNAWYDCGFAGSDPSGNKPGDCGQFNYPPGCEGKECGDNGGGYSCGECSGKGAVCTLEGTCCVPGCGEKQCGDDGCGGVCGECTDGTECVDGMCSCVPDCEGKQCGDDGCGGVCAECAAGSSCDANFTCAPDPVEPDVVTGGDVPVGGDVTVGEDTGTTDEGGGGSDCSVAGTGAPSAAALVAGLLLALAAFRRRMA
jgi:hypothetical protein